MSLLPVRQIWRTDAAQVMKKRAGSVATFRRLCLARCTSGCSDFAVHPIGDCLPGGGARHATLLARSAGRTAAGSHAGHQGPGYGEPRQATRCWSRKKRMIDAAERIPGVTAVGTTSSAPPSVMGGDQRYIRQGTADFRASNSVLDAMFYTISPGYLMPLEPNCSAGRDFTWHDDAKAPKVAIVNQTFARTMFGNSSAIEKLNSCCVRHALQDGGGGRGRQIRTLTEGPRTAMFFPWHSFETAQLRWWCARTLGRRRSARFADAR